MLERCGPAMKVSILDFNSKQRGDDVLHVFCLFLTSSWGGTGSYLFAFYLRHHFWLASKILTLFLLLPPRKSLKLSTATCCPSLRYDRGRMINVLLCSMGHLSFCVCTHCWLLRCIKHLSLHSDEQTGSSRHGWKVELQQSKAPHADKWLIAFVFSPP